MGEPRGSGNGATGNGAAGGTVDGPWKLLLRVPAFVRVSDLAALADETEGDWEPGRPARIEELREGRCIQALHVGPFGSVAATVERLRRTRRRAGPRGAGPAPRGVALRPGTNAGGAAEDRGAIVGEAALTVPPDDCRGGYFSSSTPFTFPSARRFSMIFWAEYGGTGS